MAVEHWLRLSLTTGLGPVLIARLVASTGSAAAACEMSVSDLRQVEGIGTNKASSIHTSLRQTQGEAYEEMRRAVDAGVTLICPDDQTYPELLRTIPDPPAVLYMRGALEPRDLNAIGIVGSRRCSIYGREQSERFAALLAGAGVTVTSGGARGIDTAAHRGALLCEVGRTVAVLGSGIDVPYPAENAKLFDQIALRGAVLSEYPMGTPPLADNFPRRNRIVSGMSRGILVIEADVRSGALITARQAADDHNRPVFALPGRVDNAMSAGPHKLIQDGAVLVTGLEDILGNLAPFPHEIYAGNDAPIDEYNPHDDDVSEGESSVSIDPIKEHPAHSDMSVDVLLSDRQRLIVGAMDGSPIAVDALVQATALPVQEILQELTMLSLKGVVKRVDGQSYSRRR